MRPLGPVELQATAGSQGTWTVPSNTVRIDLINLSNWPIRYAFQSGKVAASPLVFPYEYFTLEPGVPGKVEPHSVVATSGTLYYSSNGSKAKFVAIAYVE